MIPKLHELPVWIYTIEYVVIFSDGTCLVEFQDPKVLIAFSDSIEVIVLGKKISEFYRADLKKAYPEDRLLLSIIYKETREEIKNLVVLIDDMDLIEYTGCILHIKLHMW
jgi:hypothetical protein